MRRLRDFLVALVGAAAIGAVGGLALAGAIGWMVVAS